METIKENATKKLNKFTFEEKIIHSSSSAVAWSKISSLLIKDSLELFGPGIMINVQETISGCGLCVISGNTTLVSKLKTTEARNAFHEALQQWFSSKSEAYNTWRKGCILATFGDSPTAHYKIEMKELGFKELHVYDNLAHTTGTQTIYCMDIKRATK